MRRESRAPLHVAAAVITRSDDNVLLSRRPQHVPHGGLWEFPGGKVEPGEDVRQALRRELDEELGIDPRTAEPLIRIRHDYPSHAVLLDVWEVSAFSGRPHGREGQAIRWVPRDRLARLDFPAANLPVVTAAMLPSLYLITPEPGPYENWPAFLEVLGQRLREGVGLVQFRAKSLERDDYLALGTRVLEVVRGHGGRLLLNADPEAVDVLDADGVHLTAWRLAACHGRPLPRDRWVAASCHNADEVRQAAAAELDFVVLSPVLPTASHPGASTLGWQGLFELTEGSALPAYALGGLGPDDVSTARGQGAQGVAGITALWNGKMG